jgi:uncharacterized protein (DUF2236 family)
MAALFGIPAGALPEDWHAFVDYMEKMAASDVLGVSPAARSMAHAILSGAGSYIRPPQWYRALTVEWLPERLREEFSLIFSEREQRSAARARRWLPCFWRILFPVIRFVKPYREAMACLGNQPAGRFVRLSNRFWIGQSLLPFPEESGGLSLSRNLLM